MEKTTGRHTAITRYDWLRWADGHERRATPGLDFTCSSPAFAEAGRKWASRNGYTWRQTLEPGGHVVFTLTRTPQ